MLRLAPFQAFALSMSYREVTLTFSNQNELLMQSAAFTDTRGIFCAVISAWVHVHLNEDLFYACGLFVYGIM